MFEAVTIKSKEANGIPLDAGFFAECLLFYGQVNIVASKDTFNSLVSICGLDEVIELIKMGRLNLFFKEGQIGTSVFPDSKFDVQQWFKKDFNFENFIQEQLKPFVGDNEQLKSYTDLYLNHTRLFNYEENIIEQIKDDLGDKEFMKKAVASTVNYWYPNDPITSEQIETEFSEEGSFGPFKTHRFLLNIDLGKYDKVTPSGIILNVAEARGNISIAGLFNSEIADKPIYSSIIRNKFDSIVSRLEKSEAGIETFQDVVLDDYKPFGETIRSGQKSFKDLIPILEKADKFREWLGKVDGDKNIISEYYKEVSKETWIDKLPAKGTRFVLFTLAGMALDALLPTGLGTAAGVAIGAGDTFIMDKLVKGWRPNQFIDTSATDFLPKK